MTLIRGGDAAVNLRRVGDRRRTDDGQNRRAVAVRDDPARSRLHCATLVKSENPAALARRIISRVDPSAVRVTFR